MFLERWEFVKLDFEVYQMGFEGALGEGSLMIA